MQLVHSDFNSENHQLDIVVLCDGITSPANVGGVMRLADAYGVTKVVFLKGISQCSARAKSVSRGTHHFVNHSFLSQFKLDERDWFCLEYTSESRPLKSFSLKSRKIGVIIGNENTGVYDSFLKDYPSFHIQMFGRNSSMNVTQALSAALFHITNG